MEKRHRASRAGIERDKILAIGLTRWGASDAQIGAMLGISVSTLSRWRSKDQKFAAAQRGAREQWHDDHADVLKRVLIDAPTSFPPRAEEPDQLPPIESASADTASRRTSTPRKRGGRASGPKAGRP